MRDYDDYDNDHIRLYTPVLQRVIILAGVIIAVPVMMWTITTFVRSYVARPKAPPLEHVASIAPPTRAVSAGPVSSAPVEQSVTQRTSPAAVDAPKPPVEGKKTTLASLTDSTGSAAAANNPSVPSVQAAPTPTPAISAPVAAGGDGSTATVTAPPVPKLPPSALRSSDNAGLTSASASASASTDRALAWPNPNATNPPDFSAPRLAPPPAPSPQRAAAAEVLPAAEPIRGPIPMPRQRPGMFAMVASGPVPLPRMRPGDAPAVAASAAIETPTSRSDLETPH